MRTAVTIGLAMLALAGVFGGSAIRGGDGATLAQEHRAAPAAQDEDWVSPREAVILGQRINDLEARVAELEARALPRPQNSGEESNWGENGFRIRCQWLPLPDEDIPGPAEMAHGTCVRLEGPHR